MTRVAQHERDIPAKRIAWPPSGGIVWLVVFVICAAVFTTIAWLVNQTGYVAELAGGLWRVTAGYAEWEDVRPGGAGIGETVPVAIALMLRGFGLPPASLSFVNASLAAVLLGYFAFALRARRVPLGRLAAILPLIALHPVFLYAATSPSTLMMRSLPFFLLVIWVFRCEVVADVQARMALGLLLGVLGLSDSNAVYIVVAFLLMLPLLYPEIRSVTEAAANLLLVLMPALVLVVGMLVILALAQDAAIVDRLLTWSERDRSPDDMMNAFDWFRRNAGNLRSATVETVLLVGAVVPVALVAIGNAFVGRRQRRYAATAAVATIIPVAAGIAGTYFGHIHSGWLIVMNVVVGTMAWMANTPLRPAVRVLRFLALLAGTAVAWASDSMWQGVWTLRWRDALSVSMLEIRHMLFGVGG